MSLESEMRLLSDGLYLVSPLYHICPIHSRIFPEDWQIQVQAYLLIESPETAQMRDRVCEGFTTPGPDSCSCTWDRTLGGKKSH
jgi:hypothetical protein